MTGERRCSAVVSMSDDWSEPVLCGGLWPCAAHPWPAVVEEWLQAQTVEVRS